MLKEMKTSPLPILAITLGDPAGIGPEIILKALRNPDVFEQCRPVVIGDRRILQRAAEEIGLVPPHGAVEWEAVDEKDREHGQMLSTQEERGNVPLLLTARRRINSNAAALTNRGGTLLALR